MGLEKTLDIIYFLKLLIASILFFSIFLPFSSCTRVIVNERPKPPIKMIENETTNKITKIEPLEFKKNKSKIYYKERSVRYVLKDFDFKNIKDYLLVLCFIWPIPILVLSKISLRKLFKCIINFVEPTFAILAAFWIYHSFDLEPEIGAVLSFFSNVILLMFLLIESSMRFFHFGLKKT